MIFKDYFKDFLKQKLEEKISDFNINVTYDKNYFYSGDNEFKDNDLVIIISTGNDVRTKVEDTFSFFSGSVMLSIYCYDKAKSIIQNKLEDLFSELSEIGKVFTIGTIDQEESGDIKGFSTSFNFNTIGTDGLTRNINGLNVDLLTVIGTFSYYDVEHGLNFKYPKIKLNGTELKNVYSYNTNSSTITKDFNIQGSRFIKRYEDVDNVTYTISIILDKNNLIHRNLINIANKYKYPSGTYASNLMTINIADSSRTDYETGDFESFVNVSAIYNIGNFSTITLTILR